MRKEKNEIKDRAAIEAVIQEADICRLGFSVGDRPYIAPLNFGFDGQSLYFHTGREGKKIDMLRQNNRVCFELDLDCQVVRAERPCKWTMAYRSVVGYGVASLLTAPEEKRRALDIIMAHYSGPMGGYPEDLVERVAIIRVDIESMTGRRSEG